MDASVGLRRTAQRLPEKPALLLEASEVSYGALDAEVDRAAGALQQLDLGAGARVALVLPSEAPYVTALHGIWRAGLVAVPLSAGSTVRELRTLLRDAEVGAVISDDEAAPRVTEVVEELDAPPVVLRPSAWAEALAAAPEPRPTNLADDALALLQYTSGTTGLPRGAMLPHAALLANQEQMRRTRLRIVESDTVLCALPTTHIYGLNVALAFPLTQGASVALHERFEPQATLDDVERRRATVLVGAPLMYASWIQVLLAGERRRDLASVRIAVSGAARLHEAVAEAFRAVAGVPIWEGYGLTETSPLATTTAMTQEPRIGSVGLPVPDQELEVHGERGQRVERGDPGEVVLRGPNVFAGYWRAPEDTAAVLSDDGWFRTGDIGYLDDRGELRLVDRKKDLVIVSGFNVWPREVEEVLLEHPGVAGAAVVGVPDERTGEAVKAFVVPAGSGALDLEDLRAHAARHLARFKHPAEIAVVDDLPILPTGKVRRASLRDV